MTKEQEEAIEILKHFLKTCDEEYDIDLDAKISLKCNGFTTSAIETVLSILEEKDKVIDLMANDNYKVCLILADYTLTEKYAKRHSKDLFNYRIFSRNNSIFFDGYIFNVILGDDTNDNKPHTQHSSKHNAEIRKYRLYEFRQKKR